MLDVEEQLRRYGDAIESNWSADTPQWQPQVRRSPRLLIAAVAAAAVIAGVLAIGSTARDERQTVVVELPSSSTTPSEATCAPASLLELPQDVPASGATARQGTTEYQLEPITDTTNLIDLDQAKSAVMNETYAGRPVRGLLALVTKLLSPPDNPRPVVGQFDRRPIWILDYTLEPFDPIPVSISTPGIVPTPGMDPDQTCTATHMAVFVDAQSGAGVFATAAS